MVQAVLVAEPSNPYDRNAVMVVVDGEKVGYLPSEDAPDFQPVVQFVNGLGYELGCAANLTGGDPDKYFGITVHLPSAHLIRRWAGAPANSQYLIGEHSVTVTGEEYHQDVLLPLWQTSPREFHEFEIVQAEDRRGNFRIDVLHSGKRIGSLTSKMSERYHSYVIDQVQRTLATGYLSEHDTRGVQVALLLPRIG